MSQISAYRITQDGRLPLAPQADSFDRLTRQLPQGFYTTFRTYALGKRVLGLSAHLQRLFKPATLQAIEPVVSPEVLRNELRNILKGCTNEARVRLIMTVNGDIFLVLTPFKTLPIEIYQNGVKVITTSVQRESPRLKSTNFITSSESIRTQIAGSEIFEALLLRKDLILEGVTSNFFYVIDGALGTARNNILLGVTRRTVIRVGRDMDLEIRYRPLHRDQIPALEEAFLTSSSRGIVPIIQIDQFQVGEGIPGTITKQLMEAYNVYVARHTEII